jgi:hypothetical protein
MTQTKHIAFAMALEPSMHGLSYAVFDEKRRLLDWGGKQVRVAKDYNCRRIARRVRLGFDPKYVIIEDGDAPTSRRKPRLREVLRALGQDAADDGHIVVRIPRLTVRQRFSVYGIASRDDLASAVCEKYPELKPRLPKRRRPWESEHYSIAIFHAVALGVTFFDSDKVERN